MFNRFSSRLRNPTNSSKKKKAGSANASVPQASPPANSTGWTDEDDTESLDSYSAFHAESLFPIDEPVLLDPTGISDHVFNSSDDTDQGSKRSWPTSVSVPEEEIDVGPAVLPEYTEAEELFLDEYEDYFENLSVDNVRKEEYPNLDLQRVVHLDYATNPLFSRSQVEEHTELLLDEAPCSASINPSDSRLRNRIASLDDRILRMLGASKHDYPTLVLTAGLSASFRLFSEVYPFDRSTQILLAQDAPEAIRHVVSAANRSGTRINIAGLRSTDLAAPRSEIQRLLTKMASRLVIGQGGGVVSLSVQSRLSGTRYGLDWIKDAHAKGWHALLDFSTALPAVGNVDLSSADCQPDFLIGSLQQALGYPPGIGFLAVKRDVQPAMMKKLKSKVSATFVEAAGVYVACEDGGLVVNGLALAAVAAGMNQLELIGTEKIRKRVSCLASWLYKQLKRINHVDGNGVSRPMVKVYGSRDPSERGSLIVFNLVDSTGNILPANIVVRLAEKRNIKLGCCGFANHPLATAAASRHSASSLAAFRAVTLSLGAVSNFQDAYRLVQFLLRFRDEEYMSAEALDYIEESVLVKHG